MKYIISESRLISTIMKYLDNQDFIQIKNETNQVLFVNSEDSEYAELVYSPISHRCGIKNDLIREIVDFFSINDFDAEFVICTWVANKLNIEIPESVPTPFIITNKFKD